MFCYDVTNLMKNLKLDAIEISLLENDFSPGKANFNKIWIFGFQQIKNEEQIEKLLQKLESISNEILPNVDVGIRLCHCNQ